MEYRVLGRTGLKVSIIGMGCEGMVEKSPEVIRGYVDEMERLGVASILCGACEARCPFRVSIRQNMKRAAEVFGC